MIPNHLLGRVQFKPSWGEGRKYADNLKGVERAEECMMKELKDYVIEGYLQPG